jgi:hypothetical protein
MGYDITVPLTSIACLLLICLITEISAKLPKAGPKKSLLNSLMGLIWSLVIRTSPLGSFIEVTFTTQLAFMALTLPLTLHCWACEAVVIRIKTNINNAFPIRNLCLVRLQDLVKLREKRGCPEGKTKPTISPDCMVNVILLTVFWLPYILVRFCTDIDNG